MRMNLVAYQNLRLESHFRHLAAAAFLAIALRFAGLKIFALALPPFNPPRLPRDTAAASLPSSVVRSETSPVAIAAIRCASSFVSRGLLGCFVMSVVCAPLPERSSITEFQTRPLPFSMPS